jgi:hypothetical protein
MYKPQASEILKSHCLRQNLLEDFRRQSEDRHLPRSVKNQSKAIRACVRGRNIKSHRMEARLLSVDAKLWPRTDLRAGELLSISMGKRLKHAYQLRFSLCLFESLNKSGRIHTVDEKSHVIVRNTPSRTAATNCGNLYSSLRYRDHYLLPKSVQYDYLCCRGE